MEIAVILAAIRKYWAAIPILGLAAFAIYQHVEGVKQAADLKVALANATTLTATNKSQAAALDAVKAQRIDNDAIATAVAAKLTGNTTKETVIKTTIQKAIANDPKVAAWADAPVPDSVRAALSGAQK